MILEKAPLLKLTEQLNAWTFVSIFLDIVLLGVLNFLFTTQAYVQGQKWKKLLTDWNEYQESTTTMAFSFIVVNFVEKSVLHYTGLYKRALRNEQLITSNADNLKEKSWKH